MNATKCSVCDWEIKDEGIHITVGGKVVVVCCDDCAKKAQEGQCTATAGTAR